MGIPYYFAHLVKSYPEIMSAHNPANNTPGKLILYIDANSVIYDAIRDMNIADSYEPHYDAIIDATITRLKDIIKKVRGDRSESVFIAFDGVAPRAKMEQQRQRRARMGPGGLIFITPGTPFMERLTTRVKAALGERYTITGPDEPGEGEHKIFAHIRETSEALKTGQVYVYGLDADLIILGLAHCPLYLPKLKLIRERNQMTTDAGITRGSGAGTGTGTGTDADAHTLFTMDIARFSTILVEKERVNISDYIFMSFFLGNDFMPHFPALNIRTTGIKNIMHAYRQFCTGDNMFIQFTAWDKRGSDGAGLSIFWENVSKFISLLAQKEGEWFYYEHLLRDKMEARLKGRQQMPGADDAPMLFRETEQYIAPQYPNWEERYYIALFNARAGAGAGMRSDFNKADICANWLEGLEWCSKYYYEAAPSWSWTYKYNYPPLLVDIAKYCDGDGVRLEGHLFNNIDVGSPCSAAEQLAYIMPHADAPASPKLEWSYCKYTWEGHLA